MNQQYPLRLGMIGTNFVSDWMADAAWSSNRLKPCAVYSRKEETGNAFAGKHNIEKVYTDFGAFLADTDIDAVYVASPNFAHCAQTVAALEHGKHVLCEKTIATNGKELSEMVNAAKRNNRILLEAMRPAHDPGTALIAAQFPKLGKIRRVVFDFCQYSSRYDRFKNGEILNAFDPALSNAAIMDIGVYIVHICAKLFGKPKALLSMSTFLQNGFEGSGHVLADYGDMKAELSYSKITDSATPNIVMGENGSLLFGKITMPKDIRICYRNGSLENIPFTPAENNMIYEINDFCDLIAKSDVEHAYLRDSVTAMEMIDEIRRQNHIVFPTDAV